MTLPTGQLDLSLVNVELGLPQGDQLDLNHADVRSLAGVGATGQFDLSELEGKSAGPDVPDGWDAKFAVFPVRPSDAYGIEDMIGFQKAQGWLGPPVPAFGSSSSSCEGELFGETLTESNQAGLAAYYNNSKYSVKVGLTSYSDGRKGVTVARLAYQNNGAWVVVTNTSVSEVPPNFSFEITQAQHAALYAANPSLIYVYTY